MCNNKSSLLTRLETELSFPETVRLSKFIDNTGNKHLSKNLLRLIAPGFKPKGSKK